MHFMQKLFHVILRLPNLYKKFSKRESREKFLEKIYETSQCYKALFENEDKIYVLKESTLISQ
jgi:hypothetical protein